MRRVAVVTGTSRGIGRATALRLARIGFQVFGAVRSAEDAARLEHASNGSVRAVRVDLTDDAAIREAVDRLTSSGVEALHGMVNLAAADGRAVPLEAVTRADLELAELGIRVVVVEPGMTRWEDVEAQRASYGEALDEGLAAVRESERARYRRAADALKQLNRRLLDRRAPAEDVAATIERALTTRRPRDRYYCGVEQKIAAMLSRVTPPSITDRILRRLVRL